MFSLQQTSGSATWLPALSCVLRAPSTLHRGSPVRRSVGRHRVLVCHVSCPTPFIHKLTPAQRRMLLARVVLQPKADPTQLPFDIPHYFLICNGWWSCELSFVARWCHWLFGQRGKCYRNLRMDIKQLPSHYKDYFNDLSQQKNEDTVVLLSQGRVPPHKWMWLVLLRLCICCLGTLVLMFSVLRLWAMMLMPSQWPRTWDLPLELFISALMQPISEVWSWDSALT